MAQLFVSGMAHFFVVVSGSKIHERVAHFFIDIYTLGDLQAILDDADRKGKSRKTIRNIRGRLSHFFRFCRQHGWTNLRTDDLTVSDHAPAKPKTILQPEALRILFSSDLTSYGKTDSKVEPYIHAYRFQVLTGLRPGELLGLKWSDISGNVIHLQRAINFYGEETRGKNDNAVRNIIPFGVYGHEVDGDAEKMARIMETRFTQLLGEKAKQD